MTFLRARASRKRLAYWTRSHEEVPALRAHVRHVRTEYDDLLAQELDRFAAQAEVRDGVECKLEKWRSPLTSAHMTRS